jgi:hypothetical protein
MAAVGTAMALFLVLGIVGVVRDANSLTLLFLQLLALVAAGYVAGRLAGGDRVINGSLAALAVFGVTSLIGLAIAGGGVSLVALLFSGVVAAVLGSAGGALAEWGAQPKS